MRNEWHKNVADWDDYRCNDYFKWVRKTYGKEEVIKGFIHADDYRAIMDVHSSVQPEYDARPYTDALAYALQNTKDRMAANLLTKLWDNYEQEQDNKTEASEIPAKKVALEKQRKIL